MPTAFWASFFSDPALIQVKNTCDTLYLCSDEPASYYQATTTYKLGSAPLQTSDFTGPSDGSVSGRKLTLAAKQIASPTGSGTGRFVALADSVAGLVRHVKRCTPVTVQAGNAVQLDQYVIEIRDP